MKRLITADLQLCWNQRDQYRLDFFSQQLPVLLGKYKPDQLLLAGDITEAKDEHPAPLVNKIVDTICSFVDSYEIEVFILQGNHDFLHKAHPFFAFMKNYKGIRWFSKPEVVDNCLYLPHTRDYKQDWKGINFEEYDFVFAHNIFDGVKANGQSLSGGIPTSIFPDSAVVLSGDVHEPQVLDGGKVIYVGSPFLCDFGDSYQPRVLLLDDLKMKSIRVHGPQKRVIEVGNEGNILHAKNWNEGDIVKIKAHLEMKDVAGWDKRRSELIAWAAQEKLVLYTIVPIVAYDMGGRAKPIQGSKKTDEQYFDQFAKRNAVDEYTMRVGKELMDE